MENDTAKSELIMRKFDPISTAEPDGVPPGEVKSLDSPSTERSNTVQDKTRPAGWPNSGFRTQTHAFGSFEMHVGTFRWSA